MKDKHSSGGPAVKQQSKKTRLTRAQKKAQKNATLPVHKRPIICLPDRAGRHPLFRALGIICRALVIWLATAGLAIFVSDALQFGAGHGIIFLTALCTVSAVMLFLHSWVGKIISCVGTVGAIGAIAALKTQLLLEIIPYSFIGMYNATLDRLYRVGYLTYTRFKVNISASILTPEEDLVVAGVCVLTVLIGILFTVCLAKRVQLVPPAILATSLLVFILTFNIYSNKVGSNLGIALLIVSFASVLCMGAYDRLYHKKNDKRYDNGLSLFEDSDRPVLPAAYVEEMAARADRQKNRSELRRKRRTHTVTVEDEISDYFSTGSRSDKKKASKEAAKAEKAARREMMRKVRRVQKYDRATQEARTAMSGFAAAAAMLICLLAIALPALMVKGNFSTIDTIDEKVSLVRDYVTALLRGDDEALDRLEYGADKDNFEPHSTDLEQLEFTGKQIFFVRSRYNSNLYLRGWIGTDYEDGAWLAVDEETLNQYHDLFGEDASPAEDMKYNFYHYMLPELVDDLGSDIGTGTPEFYLNRFKSNLDYGFVGTMVSLRRVNSPSTLTYFPSSYVTRYGLYQFNSVEPHDLTFVNYYDGLYTGRNFDKSGVSYATIAYAPVMTNRFWIQNQANLQAAYNLHKEALLPYTAIRYYEDGTVSSQVELEVIELGNTLAFRYTVEERGKEDITWIFYHNAEDCQELRFDAGTGQSSRRYIIQTACGELTIDLDGRKVIATGVENTTVGVNLWQQYDQNYTDEQRSELLEHLVTERDYSDFIYETYTATSGSDALKALAQTIRGQAHTETTEVVTEEIPDDPETPEDDSYTKTNRVTVNVPADVSRADERNSSDADVYMQRDLLVRNVIDYIITEQACSYTLTPDLSAVDNSLDGVENFLFNTKEGYCVQYASAAALLLREMNIPVRYVEGYVASGLSKLPGQDFVYEGYVLDRQAHAWIEVYFDGVGWIQYETTPQYYIGLYGTSEAVSSTPDTPADTETETETTPAAPIETETESEDESDSDSGSETDEDDSAAITRGGLIALGVIVGLVAILVLLRAIASTARQAEDRRQSVAIQVLESGFGQNTSPEDRREMALSMTDAIHDLLAILDLSPEPGEFREAYAERLSADLAATAVKTVRGADTQTAAEKLADLPNVRMAMDGMAAEEFGHGMTIAEMKTVAALYLYLHAEVRRRISPTRRMKLRYIQHKI